MGYNLSELDILKIDSTISYSPAAQIIVFLVIFGLCALNSTVISLTARRILCTVDRFYVFVVFSVTQMVVLTTILGVVGRLNLQLLAASEAGLFLLIRFVLSRPGARRRNVASYTPAERMPSPFLTSPVLIVLSAIAAAAGAFLFAWAVLSPPPPSDAFLYHLPLPTRWMQTGSIIPDNFGPFAGVFHPSNPETLLLWLIIPFHDDILTNLMSWVFWAGCAAAVYSLARALGTRHSDGVFAALIWSALPLAVRTATSSEVDLFASFFLLTGLLFALRYRTERHVVFLLWGGLSLGIYMGSKLIAPPFTFPVIALYAAAIFERRVKRANNLLILLLAASLLSLFWYATNAVLNDTHNPFHPLRIELFGRVLLRGAITRDVVAESHAHAGEPGVFVDVLTEIFGPYLAPFLVLCLFFAIAARLFRGGRFSVGVLCVPLLLTAMFWWLIGVNRENSARYLFPAAALCCVAWAVAAPRRKLPRLVFQLTTLALVAITIYENRYLRTIVAEFLSKAFSTGADPGAGVSQVRWLLALCVAGGVPLFLCFASGPKMRRLMFAVFVVMSAALFAVQFDGLSRYYRATKYSWYRAALPDLGYSWSRVDAIVPKPIDIGVTDTNMYHGYYGTRLLNRVYRVDYVLFNSEEKWLAGLAEAGIDVVALKRFPLIVNSTVTMGLDESVEYRIARRLTDRFQLIGADGNTYVFRYFQ